MSREASLRPECADLYPALHSVKWEPVAIIVDKLIADLVLRQRAGMNSVQAARRLTPEHFEFRERAGPSDAPREGGRLQSAT